MSYFLNQLNLDSDDSEFALGFHVRWNTTYDMLERFFFFKRIIDDIGNSSNILFKSFVSKISYRMKVNASFENFILKMKNLN